MCKLQDLYESTAEDFRYGIGVMQLDDGPPAPVIQIYYRDWSRDKLELVRESFRQGVTLAIFDQPDGLHELHLATQERIIIEERAGDHTDALCAPAWDARLVGVEDVALRQFQVGRRRCGGFLLVLQTPEWEFVTLVGDGTGSVELGEVRPRCISTPERNVTN